METDAGKTEAKAKKLVLRFAIISLIMTAAAVVLALSWFAIFAQDGLAIANSLKSADKVEIYNRNAASGDTLVANYGRADREFLFMLYTMATANKYGEP